jgi:hypothetical protein
VPGKASRAQKHFGWTWTEPSASVQRKDDTSLQAEVATDAAPSAGQQSKDRDAPTQAERDTTLAEHEEAQSGITGSGGQLPHLDEIQNSFGGHDLSRVKAHTDTAAGDGATALGASAYATGHDVAFRGPPDLHTAAHEAAHVIQQREGVHLQRGVGCDGDEYERNADAVADRVVAGRSAADLLPQPGKGGGTDSATQRKPLQRKPESASAPSAPDAAVHDHAGRLRQLADPHSPSNPNNTLDPYEMYQVWLDLWTARNAAAQPRLQDLEERIRAANPADFADKMDLFRQGRRDVLGPEYELAANEADLCSAQLSVMSDILEWLEARKAASQHVTLDQVNRRALATAEAKAIYVNTLMTVLLVGYPTAVASRAPTSMTALHSSGTGAGKGAVGAKGGVLEGAAGTRAARMGPLAEEARGVASQGPTRIYSTRELMRRTAEPGPFHNFPQSFDSLIFERGTRSVTPDFYRTAKPGLSNHSVMYTLRGSVNGHAGTFEIGVRPSISGRTEVIIHRFFRPDP